MSTSTTDAMMCPANVQDPETILSPSLRAALAPVAGTSPLPSPLPKGEGGKKTKAPLVYLNMLVHNHFTIGKDKRDRIKDCLESYCRDWATSTLEVMFQIDNSPKAKDDFEIFLNNPISGLTDRTYITLHTDICGGIKYYEFLTVDIKGGKVNVACPDVSVIVAAGDQYAEYNNSATSRLRIALYTIMAYFLPNDAEFKCGYDEYFPDGDLGDCLPDEEAIKISLNISNDVQKYCEEWVRKNRDHKNSVGGKSVKVRMSGVGPY